MILYYTMSKQANKKLGLECELASHSTKSGNFYGLIFGCPKHLVELENAIELLGVNNQ